MLLPVLLCSEGKLAVGIIPELLQPSIQPSLHLVDLAEVILSFPISSSFLLGLVRCLKARQPLPLSLLLDNCIDHHLRVETAGQAIIRLHAAESESSLQLEDVEELTILCLALG